MTNDELKEIIYEYLVYSYNENLIKFNQEVRREIEEWVDEIWSKNKL